MIIIFKENDRIKENGYRSTLLIRIITCYQDFCRTRNSGNIILLAIFKNVEDDLMNVFRVKYFPTYFASRSFANLSDSIYSIAILWLIQTSTLDVSVNGFVLRRLVPLPYVVFSLDRLLIVMRLRHLLV